MNEQTFSIKTFFLYVFEIRIGVKKCFCIIKVFLSKN